MNFQEKHTINSCVNFGMCVDDSFYNLRELAYSSGSSFISVSNSSAFAPHAAGSSHEWLTQTRHTTHNPDHLHLA